MQSAEMQVFCTGDFSYMAALTPFTPKDRPMAILDIGANAGFASWLFTRFMRFEGDLVAVEPHKETFEMLLRNIEPTAAAPGFNFFPINSAVVSAVRAIAEPKLLLSTQSEGVFMNMHLDKRNTDAESVSVTSISLAEVVVRALKI
jgi:FkbM family methyltransferase